MVVGRRAIVESLWWFGRPTVLIIKLAVVRALLIMESLSWLTGSVGLLIIKLAVEYSSRD